MYIHQKFHFPIVKHCNRVDCAIAGLVELDHESQARFRVGYKNANWKKDSQPTQSTLLASTFNLQNLWGLKNKKFMSN